MTDRKKVIKGLECCQHSSKSHCDGCPYVYDGLCSTNDCTAELASDSIAMLKELEPVEPALLVSKGPGDVCSQWYLCGKCKKPIDYKDRFCKRCGQAVKWNES